MERRRISLRGLFAQYLLWIAGAWAFLCVAGYMMFGVLINQEIVLPASTAAQQTAQAVSLARTQTAQSFRKVSWPSLCRYAVYSSPQADAPLLYTNMTDAQLKKAENARKGGSGNLGYMQYHTEVALTDGSMCLFQYDYSVPYVDARLQRWLPDFQAGYLLVLAGLCLAAAGLITHRFASLLGRQTVLLTEACARIAAGDASPMPQRKAQVKEFAAAQKTIEQLRSELETSLKAQWRLEQQRSRQIAALTHDLKTPLTIMQGNAELLAEDSLTQQQQRYVQAVLRAADNACSYLARLREMAVTGNGGFAPAASLQLETVFRQCAELGRGLCEAKGVCFVASAPHELAFRGCEQELVRGVSNLLENAVRFTPAGGKVAFEVQQKSGFLVFAVQDSGPGFSPQAIGCAGQMLYTGETARPQNGHMGMGLYFAHAVARYHGGKLTVCNTPQGGRAMLSVKL